MPRIAITGHMNLTAGSVPLVAYESANEVLVSTCDTLFAVWDGQNGTDKGGTASVVEYARSRGVPVEVIWPEGAARGEAAPASNNPTNTIATWSETRK